MSYLGQNVKPQLPTTLFPMKIDHSSVVNASLAAPAYPNKITIPLGRNLSMKRLVVN